MLKETLTRMGRARWLLLGGIPVLLAVAVLFSSHARAFGPWHHHGKVTPEEMRAHLDRRVEHLLDKVDASDAQRDKVDAIVDRTAPQFVALMTEGRALREEIKTALLAEQLDTARIETARRSLDALTARLTDTGMDALVSVSEVLTAAQRKQIADDLARWHR